MDPDDDTIRDALKALEGVAPPHDYFDGLPRAIEARLDAAAEETGSMQGNAVPRDENSGLHDIKELAKSQKTRISRRQTSQHDIQDSLLASSQSGLHAAVALPDPAKMISLPSVDEARALAQSAAHAAAEDGIAAPARGAVEARPGKRSGGVPAWMLASGGVALAAAAVIAVIVMTGGSKNAEPTKAGSQTVAAEDNAPAKDTASNGASGAAGVGSGSAAAMAEPPPPQIEPLPADEGVTTTGIADTEALEPEAAAEGGEGHAAKRKEKTGHGSDSTERTDDNAGSNTADKTVKSDTQVKTDKKSGGGGTGSGSGAKEKLDGAVLGAGDKDELGIGDVMKGGGGKEEAPKKTELTSKEMRAGLAAIEGKAKSCYGKYNVPGTVKVKLTIDPKGEVSKASASGDLAGTPSADCVVDAVKSASFPAWEGGPQSTTFVVLLSD